MGIRNRNYGNSSFSINSSRMPRGKVLRVGVSHQMDSESCVSGESGGENYFGPEIEVESHGRKRFNKAQVSGELWSILPDHISWLYKIYTVETRKSVT